MQPVVRVAARAKRLADLLLVEDALVEELGPGLAMGLLPGLESGRVEGGHVVLGGRRHPLEGVEEVDVAVGLGLLCEHEQHREHGPASPDAALGKRAWNAPPYDVPHGV